MQDAAQTEFLGRLTACSTGKVLGATFKKYVSSERLHLMDLHWGYSGVFRFTQVPACPLPLCPFVCSDCTLTCTVSFVFL